MRSEVLALVAAAGTDAALLFYAFSHFELFFVLFFGIIVAGGAFLGITFLPKYPVRDVRAEPGAALAYLANRLRLMGYRVAESPGRLTVRIGSFSAILVTARPTPSGCRVLYQPFATPSGWGTLLTLLIIVYTGLAGLGLAAYGFLRAWSFSTSVVAPLLPVDGSLPAIPVEDRTRSVLLETLSEAHRAAAEATEALRSNYWDLQTIVIGGAIIVWLFAFILFSMDVNRDFTARMTMGAARATAAVAAAAIPLGILIRVRLRPNVLLHRAHAERLRAAMARASAPGAPEGSEPSAFELLMDASVEVPSWIQVSRRGGLNRDPAAGLFILVAAVWSFSLVSAAFSFVFFNPLLAALLGSLGITLSVIATLFYRRWKRRWEEETQRALRDWKGRIDRIRAEMSRYIEDL